MSFLLQDKSFGADPAIAQVALGQGAESEAIDDLILYPESDGKPMAENTEQYRWIVMLKENLEVLFAAVEVFIAADLLWYPVQVKNSPDAVVEPFYLRSQAPDVMVIFGRPKGKRGSYRQWQENNIPPQVVFEILSPSNTTTQGVREMQSKFNFYQTHGVEEYYIYDPETYKLQGWLRQGENLEAIANTNNWTSPRLGIRFVEQSNQDLEIYYPDGRKFISTQEFSAQAEKAQEQAQLAQQQAQLAQAEAQLAQQQVQLAQEEAQLAQQQTEQREAQLQQAVARLLERGIAKEELVELINLSEEQIRRWL
jgi:Uma2 family endonuclease